MKNYNKILKAVNRGILLALDDFDDEEQVLNIKSKQVLNRDYTNEYLDLLKYEAVDLGLPSGTLWCKYNLDVNPNLLSKAKDWYGSYYAWGELEPNKTNKDGKIYFGWDNYKNYKYSKLTKYCNNPKYGLNGFTDNLNELLPEDDVAYQKKKFYNFKFHIPTKKQCEELIKYTTNYWVNNYNPNNMEHHTNDKGIKGLNGRIFKGTNGNQLFIPATGYYDGSNIECVGSDCYLWSSSLNLDYSYYAHILYFIDLDAASIDDCNKCIGLPIHPVIKI